MSGPKLNWDRVGRERALFQRAKRVLPAPGSYDHDITCEIVRKRNAKLAARRAS